MIDYTRYPHLTVFAKGLFWGLLVSLIYLMIAVPLNIGKSVMVVKDIFGLMSKDAKYNNTMFKLSFSPSDYNGMFAIDNNQIVSVNFMGRCPAHSLAYSLKRFMQVKSGMTENEVIDLLGEPLRKEHDHPDKNIIIWRYATYVVAGHDHFQRDIHFENGEVVKVIMRTSYPM